MQKQETVNDNQVPSKVSAVKGWEQDFHQLAYLFKP